jgi:broad specificity phosphatase PhoE
MPFPRFIFCATARRNGTRRAQALRQGQILGSVDLRGYAFLTSPQDRATQTAAIALARWGADLHIEPRLREIGVGDWAGRILADLCHETGSDDPLAVYEKAPGGEGFVSLEQRCRAFLACLRGPAVLVTHGITSRMIRAIATGAGRAGMADIGCGQGVVYHVAKAVQIRLE